MAVGVLPLVMVAIMGALVLNGGHVKVGGVLSTFEIVNVQLETLFALLVAVHPMNTTPSVAKLTGLVTLQLCVKIPDGEVAFGAMKVPKAAVETPPVGLVVELAGQINVGGAESKTANDSKPPEIVLPEVMTLIVKAEVTLVGVDEKENVWPPSLVANPVGTAVEVATKSDATAEVAPAAPETVMTHLIAIPFWAETLPGHERLEDVVGVP